MIVVMWETYCSYCDSSDRGSYCGYCDSDNRAAYSGYCDSGDRWSLLAVTLIGVI